MMGLQIIQFLKQRDISASAVAVERPGKLHNRIESGEAQLNSLYNISPRFSHERSEALILASNQLQISIASSTIFCRIKSDL